VAHRDLLSRTNSTEIDINPGTDNSDHPFRLGTVRIEDSGSEVRAPSETRETAREPGWAQPRLKLEFARYENVDAPA
jgi:hypothetical protein